MKKIMSISIYLVFLLLLQSCKDSRPDVLVKYVKERVNNESEGAFDVSGIGNINGVEQNIGGSIKYEIDFTMTLVPHRTCWKNGNAFQGYWDDFTVADKIPDGWEGRNWANAKQLTAGSFIQLKGKATMVKKSNGWEVEKITIL
ncbi:MAG: hypothetical protein JSS76_00615 [Bacteroidetes bacterium]|nr:hypothetical protein [Bacteroidota bacterium]